MRYDSVSRAVRPGGIIQVGPTQRIVFDFLGAAKVIECVKDVILQLWDRVVSFRERKVANRLELVAQSLPILDRIDEMEKSGKMEREQAAILKKRITHGCMQFVQGGATIPEIQGAAHVEPRLLLAPEQKLLAGPGEMSPNITEKDVTPTASNRDTGDQITSEERAILREMAQKRAQK